MSATRHCERPSRQHPAPSSSRMYAALVHRLLDATTRGPVGRPSGKASGLRLGQRRQARANHPSTSGSSSAPMNVSVSGRRGQHHPTVLRSSSCPPEADARRVHRRSPCSATTNACPSIRSRAQRISAVIALVANVNAAVHRPRSPRPGLRGWRYTLWEAYVITETQPEASLSAVLER